MHCETDFSPSLALINIISR